MNKETLTELGFIEIGNWLLNNDNRKITPQYSKPEFKYILNTLYAFTYETDNDEITLGYIGKTTKSIDARFNGYMIPGSDQQTNIRINQRIKEKLNMGILVEIFALPDISPLQWQGYNLNIAAGIEDSLINGLRPEWNLHGIKNSNKILNTQEEIESIIESNLYLNVPPTTISNELNDNNIEQNNYDDVYFEVKLGDTYYNKNRPGFMNPGVNASLFLGNEGENSTLNLNTNLVLQSTINRTANGGAVRFHWGSDLMEFYRTHFQFNDILLFKIEDNNKIVFVSKL